MAQKIPCKGKHGEFGNFAKIQGIWFAQAVKSLIQMVKDISKVRVRFVYVNWHRENLAFDRENSGNLKMPFEWVPRYFEISVGIILWMFNI